MAKRPADAKTRSLKEHGCLNPHAETVRDELFLSNAFFDPRDLVQVRYEMLRRVREDGMPVSHAAASFGVSRPTWYQAQRKRLACPILLRNPVFGLTVRHGNEPWRIDRDDGFWIDRGRRRWG